MLKGEDGTRGMQPLPQDWAERQRALDPEESFLVQAPAGSGKTYLLTQRFLRLLAQVEKPEEIVAITFTNAAAAEMRNRILGELEKAAVATEADEDAQGLRALARRALEHSKRMGWEILDQPGQLRITTIDAFCRSLALQSPLNWGMLSGLGGKLDPVNRPKDLYRLAARRTLELLEGADTPERESVEAVLEWRDNSWKEVEELIAKMLQVRNRWFQPFVFAREIGQDELLNWLEAPFRRAARGRLRGISSMLYELPESREFALDLARNACESPGKYSPFSLAERAEFPGVGGAGGVTDDAATLQDAVDAYRDLANFLLTKGEWRREKGLNAQFGFPATVEGRKAKGRFAEFAESLAELPGFQAALAAFQHPIPVRYSDGERILMGHCFAVLRVAFAQLQTVFAESGLVDFTEVSQIALRVLAEEDGRASEFAIRQADGIRHLLVDEFQDTSRNQHLLLSRLIGAWPEREGRSCFCVGDPMQSIYGFREAEVELFERTRRLGLDTRRTDPDSLPLRLQPIGLRANFRTVPSLVNDLNGHFERIFAEDDGSGVRFSPVEAARVSPSAAKTELHLAFTVAAKDEGDASVPGNCAAGQTRQSQLDQIVALIRERLSAESGRERYRIAVLGRTKPVVIRVAEALRAAGIGFRAIDLVPLRERPEVLDALSVARALLNPMDRTAWLGVLRAPWCGLSLEELYWITSGDDKSVSATAVPQLLATRLGPLRAEGRLDARALAAAERVAEVMGAAASARTSVTCQSLGTWLESVWKALGGADCVTLEQRQNLRLLWRALDGLNGGELDLVGPGLDAALEDLCALPDPEASEDFGVQLMTIHKSKGLEFEAVIVPDLEANARTSNSSLLSWLERGLADEDDGDLTEFLIAPIQAKGTDSGGAKKWVDGVKRERATQELRRLLYVAATRAREELHFFARPKFSVSRKHGTPELVLAVHTGLLATASPAFGERVDVRFAQWLNEMQNEAEPETVESLAAVGTFTNGGNLLAMPRATRPNAIRPTMLRRLPEDYADFRLSARSFEQGVDDRAGGASVSGDRGMEPLYARMEGGLESRVLGKAIHELLEHLTQQLAETKSAGDFTLGAALQSAQPGIAAAIRGQGFSSGAADRLAAQASTVARQAALDPVGAWILAPHANAGVELRWTGLVQLPMGYGEVRREIRNLRPDRVFLSAAGAALAARPTGATLPKEPVWWIVDYKTSSDSGANLSGREERERFLAEHREQHLGQLAAYAAVLRGLFQPDKGLPEAEVRAGIYYPRLQLFDFWNA